MSTRWNQSNGDHLLELPVGLLLIGFVLVKPKHRAELPRDRTAATVTLWGHPGDPETLKQVHHQQATGREPAALLLIFPSSLEVRLSPQWRQVRWLTEYIAKLAKQIARQGPEQFFTAMLVASTPVTAS